MVLSRIRLENLRCIRAVDLDLAPLTILYGENGAGKSSVIEGLQLLKQSANQRINLHGIEYRSGEGVTTGLDFGEYHDVVLNNDEKNWITLEIETRPTISERQELDEAIKHIQRLHTFTIPQNLLKTVNHLGLSVSFREREIKQSILVNSEFLETVEYVQASPMSNPTSRITYPEVLVGKPRVQGGDNFLSPEVFLVQSDQEVGALCELSACIVRIFQTRLQNTYLLSASRGDMARSHQGGKKPSWVGIRGEQIVELLALIFSLSRSRYVEIADKIKLWARTFQIKELHAGWIGEAWLKASFRDPKLPNARPNLADAGRGSRQVLSIITQIFFSESGSTILIEEPEASLHFGLIIDLMKLFGEAIKENKQIIITTHSPAIPSMLKRCVKSKILEVKDVAIYELQKEKDGSTAKRLPITKEGIVKGFIPSIAKAEKMLLEEY